MAVSYKKLWKLLIDCIDDQIKKSRTNKYVYSILGMI